MTAMPPRLARITLAIACCCCYQAHAAAPVPDLRAVVDATIVPLMAEHGIPGMSIAVTVDGKSTSFQYGLASKQEQIQVTADTLFELGSTSKTLAATLASYAQAQGKLRYDDHPSKYMPQLKGSAIDQATLLHLGTYTAGGLPQQFPDALTDGDADSYFQRWKADAAPGVQRRYSNPSLGLFGHLAALALHSSYADAMEQQLLPQLGMHSTHIRIPAARMKHYAWGHDSANKPVRMRPEPMYGPNYGLVSTADDMLRLVQANLAPRHLAAPLRGAVEGTQRGYFKVGQMMQGLGWEQYSYPVALEDLSFGNSPAVSAEPRAAQPIAVPRIPTEPTLFNKTGGTRGFSSYVAFVPQRQLGIVMLANKSYPGAARIRAAHAILTALQQTSSTK